MAKATGLDSQKVGKLLMMLAPLVMAALARARSTQGAAGASAGSVLQREQSNIERQIPGLGGLASILDRDGVGQIADDIASIAAGQEVKDGSGTVLVPAGLAPNATIVPSRIWRCAGVRNA